MPFMDFFLISWSQSKFIFLKYQDDYQDIIIVLKNSKNCTLSSWNVLWLSRGLF